MWPSAPTASRRPMRTGCAGGVVYIVYSRGADKEPDVDALLPESFLEWTEGRGLVVKSSAPQVEVLHHNAVGGFVTHLGWNSVLEAIVAEVPMVGWPLYAEQHMNIVLLVEELRLAAAVKGYKGELLLSKEIEAKVRWLMESDGGQKLRERERERRR
ncbi:phloretin 2'-O-glucosyltransferase-like [Canna indica]|uniref:Phloretin 2'-O-glucosyltransferase-like n=1 Tax=Canna indica TaxID=4628 RepID=A0AAQ3KQT0_9LILI|nr:phloretin 2'-O-glucosyltransferase-like [Canna indica]